MKFYTMELLYSLYYIFDRTETKFTVIVWQCFLRCMFFFSFFVFLSIVVNLPILEFPFPISIVTKLERFLLRRSQVLTSYDWKDLVKNISICDSTCGNGGKIRWTIRWTFLRQIRIKKMIYIFLFFPSIFTFGEPP